MSTTITINPPAPASISHQLGPTTSSIELQQLQQPSRVPSLLQDAQQPETGDAAAGSATVGTAVDAKQKWNEPRMNRWRVFATFFSFVVMGANDSAYGALIPYIEPYYHLTYTVVSLLFLAPFIGYVFAAALNNAFHMRFGRRGVAAIGPACHLVTFLVLALHPPYPVIVCVCVLGGFGTGILDAAWNAWIGNMASANELLGFLHGFYGLGATLGPLIATTLVTKAGWQWYGFYYIMIGAGVIELSAALFTFWTENGEKFRREHPRTGNSKGGRTREALSNKVTWTVAIFLLCYVGVEVALGGWIVTFMIQVRRSNPFASGMSSVGFWMGITVGRVVLGFVTGKIGEKLAIAMYLAISVGLELLFWLIPQFIVSAVAVAFLGFFLGPLFPGAVIAATKLLPPHLHVSAIGFAAAFGGSGAALLPFSVGAIAQAKGVQVLQPIILALLVVSLGLWGMLPKITKTKKEDETTTGGEEGERLG
ncbi:MAG: hypothetical protein M4579_004688 [Chaenotheca gracillima]|nr:MAG: hypothetical protein M4579_004688 [Chaenotheca gracillima]